MALEELKNKIKEDYLISEIIGSYITLNKHHGNHMALCPFHGDTKPSMHVTDSKKMFKCFACGVGGDAISFVMKYTNVDFVEALKSICEKLNLPWEEYKQEKKRSPKFDMALKLLTKSTQVYQKIAETSGSDIFKDFCEKRKIPNEIAKKYQLGIAPKNSVLFEYFSSIKNSKDKEFALKTAEEIGLIKPSQYDSTGSHYDTFRERIVFPIWDHYGHVIGYTTRATRDDQKAKYMNSKDSYIFNKGNLLYGLHLAKNSIRENERVILVEGNMDQLSLYANGFEESVAIMGTALGEKSLPSLLALTKNIYLCLDNDPAGLKASQRANEILLKRQIIAKYIDLGSFKDPDELILAEGRLAFNKRLDEAKAFIDIELKNLIPAKVPEMTDRKLELLNKCFEILAPLGNSLHASERIIQFARNINLQTDKSEIINFYKSHLERIDKLEKKSQQNRATNKSQFAHNETKKQANVEANDAGHLEDGFLEHLSENENLELEPEMSANTRPLSSVEKNLIRCLFENNELLSNDRMQELLDLVDHSEVQKYVLNLMKLVMEVDEKEFEKIALEVAQNENYSQDLRDVVGSAVYTSNQKSEVSVDEESDTDEEKMLDQLVFELKRRLQIENLKRDKKNLMTKQLSTLTQEAGNEILIQMSQIDKTINEINNTKYKK